MLHNLLYLIIAYVGVDIIIGKGIRFNKANYFIEYYDSGLGSHDF